MAEPAWYESYKPASQAQPGTVVQPGSPLLQRRVQAQTTKDEVEAALAPALAGAKITEAKTEADKAAREAAKEARAEEARRLAKVRRTMEQDEYLRQLGAIRQRVNAITTGMPGAVLKNIPGTMASDLSRLLTTVGANQAFDRLQRMREESPTGGALGNVTEKELELLKNSQTAVSQDMTVELLQDQLAAHERLYRRGMAAVLGADPNVDMVQRVIGVGEDAPLARKETDLEPGRDRRDLRIAGLDRQIAALVAGGATEEQVRAYADEISPGLGAKLVGVKEAIEYQRVNPSLPLNVDVESKFEPTEGTGAAALEAAGDSPVGAFAANFADVATSGTLDTATGEPEEANLIISELRNRYPVPSMLGSVAGGVTTGAAGMKALTGAAGLGRGGASLASEATLGAGYGAGSADDGYRGEGAVQGLLLAGAGNVGGRAAGDVIGRSLTGITNPDVRTLLDRNVRLSPGQMLARSADDVNGSPDLANTQSWTNRFEQSMASAPIIGDRIRDRRLESRADFTRAAKREVAEPIAPYSPTGVSDEIGVPGNTELQGKIGDVFETAFRGQTLTPDAPFLRDAFRTLRQLRRVREVGPGMADEMERLTNLYLRNNQGATGKDIQEFYRMLAEAANKPAVRDSVQASQVRDLTGQFTGALDALVERQIPGAVEQYGAAKDAWRRYVPYSEAIIRGANRDVATPYQLAEEGKRAGSMFGGRSLARTGREPFSELTQAGLRIIPETVPDSGTATRLAALGAIGLTGGGVGAASADKDESAFGEGVAGAGKSLLGLAALSAPWTRTGSAAIRNFLAPSRSQRLIDLGRGVSRNSPYAAAGVRPGIITGYREETRLPPSQPIEPRAEEADTDIIDVGGGVRYNRKTDEFTLPNGTVVPRGE